MEIWFWASAAVLFGGAAVFFAAKCFLLKRAARTLSEQLAEREGEETNVLLSVPVRDRDMLRLTETLNRSVRALSEERHRLQQGDRVLKAAVQDVSHDLRTPLTAIRGYLDLLRREALPPDGARYAAVLSERAEALSARVDELFRYTVTLSEDVPRPVPLDVRDVLAESLAASFGTLSARGVEPQICLPDAPVICRADRGCLLRIFENLLTNAEKYTGGDLAVALAPDGKVTFENSAPGLTPVQAARLFDRFYTVEDGGGSTGLGLSIARTLAEKTGGTLSAKLENGRLRVTLLLPGGK